EHLVLVPHALLIQDDAPGGDLRRKVTAQALDVLRRGFDRHHQPRAGLQSLARIYPDIGAAIEYDVAGVNVLFAHSVNLPLLLGEIEWEHEIAALRDPEAAVGRIPQMISGGIFLQQL